MPKRRILICTGTGCISSGSKKIAKSFIEKIAEQGLQEAFQVTITGCHGFCEQGALVIIEPEDILYCRVQENDVDEIIEKTLHNNQIIDRLLYQASENNKKAITFHDIDFYKKQQRIVLKNCGYINPEEIDEYLGKQGYKALEKALKMKQTDIIEEIKKSGLRGRGGGGFPTGLKWQFTHKAVSDKKYIVCNADEGDPGAFMDRSLLEGDPHAVIEGILICGFAVGADEGYIYVRAEYPLAIERLQWAIKQAEECGYLGTGILDSDFNFKLSIKAGAGAFVCGEETALLTSIEGNRGMPTVRPPFPAVKGLWGKPTIINNVETFGNIPVIIRDGADWFASIGTENSKGTKVFALTGKVNNTGLAEVPMGVTIREIIFGIGGGIKNGGSFKAVQIGGPSGGCLPAEFLELAVDYDSLIEAGAMMGSGGLVVLDNTTCMVDLAKFFLQFTQKESCGKCTPCREGTKRMLEILIRITKGEGEKEDIVMLQRLGENIKKTSLCGLGQTAPNPVLSTLRYFKNEYQAHINDKKCPAGVCRELISYIINPDLCNGCTLCVLSCPVEAITGNKKEVHFIDDNKCTRCGVCVTKCKKEAIYIE